ncbi:MAG: LacI family DNA-binding transcriptional regulator [Flavisolibacter sp.]|nr:LacI family DNA-binding transcriptional regulator [Flavisolibacter sp.]
MIKRKVSIKDITRHLDVSTALVSYVLNNKEKEARVGEEMAKKIRKAATKLKYQRNLIAKSLKSGKTNTIGLIVADISNPFFSNIARIIEDEAKSHGYTVIFVRVPDELAVISFDESDAFDFFYSPVTYIKQSVSGIGREAVNILLNEIRQGSKKYAQIEVEADLIIRESSRILFAEKAAS